MGEQTAELMHDLAFCRGLHFSDYMSAEQFRKRECRFTSKRHILEYSKKGHRTESQAMGNLIPVGDQTLTRALLDGKKGGTC